MPDNPRILICGDRDWNDSSNGFLISKFVDSLPEDAIIIEGEARGADKTSRKAAEERGFTDDQILRFPADWSIGLGGGPVRNARMLREGKPTHVVAFHKDIKSSKGTKDMVKRSLKAGIPVFVNIESWIDIETNNCQIFEV